MSSQCARVYIYETKHILKPNGKALIKPLCLIVIWRFSISWLLTWRSAFCCSLYTYLCQIRTQKFAYSARVMFVNALYCHEYSQWNCTVLSTVAQIYQNVLLLFLTEEVTPNAAVCATPCSCSSYWLPVLWPVLVSYGCKLHWKKI